MRPAATESLSRRLRPLSLAVAATVAASLPPFLVGGAAVELGHDLGVSVAEVGATVSAYFGASAVFSNAMGRLSHAVGPRRSLLVSCSLSAIGTLGVFLTAHSFATLFPWLALAGVANALSQPSTNALLSDGISPRHLGAAIAVKQAAIPLASLISGVTIPLLVVTVGWRASFLFASCFALGAAVVVPAAMDPAAPSEGIGGATTMSGRMLGAMGVAGGLGAVAGNALGAFLVSSAVAIGVGQGEAGILLAAGSLLCIAVRVLAGGWVDGRGSDGLDLIVAMLLLGTLGFAGLATGIPELLILAAVLAFGAGWGWPGLFQFTIVVHNPDTPALATGLTQTGTYVGAALGPLAFGLLASRSYSLAWSMVIAVMACASAVILLCRSRVRANPHPAPAYPDPQALA